MIIPPTMISDVFTVDEDVGDDLESDIIKLQEPRLTVDP
jgi:hypothetical protein